MGAGAGRAGWGAAVGIGAGLGAVTGGSVRAIGRGVTDRGGGGCVMGCGWGRKAPGWGGRGCFGAGGRRSITFGRLSSARGGAGV
jgi:hypothetical protein